MLPLVQMVCKKGINLTLTSVVFEFIIFGHINNTVKYLTLTSVVFEFIADVPTKPSSRYLTLTSVVFEYKITWCRA